MLAVESKPVSPVRHYREFHVINDWVLMEPDGVRETEGGIYLPDSVEDEFASRDGKWSMAVSNLAEATPKKWTWRAPTRLDF